MLFILRGSFFLKETSNKDLSNLAKAAFELLKWRVFGEPHLRKAVPIIVSLANDPNWRTRSATLTFLRSFMYRYAIGWIHYVVLSLYILCSRHL